MGGFYEQNAAGLRQSGYPEEVKEMESLMKGELNKLPHSFGEIKPYKNQK